MLSVLHMYTEHLAHDPIILLQWFSLPLQAILQEHCNHNVVNIVFWLASVMIVSNKPTRLLAMACKMQTVTGFNLAISKLPN